MKNSIKDIDDNKILELYNSGLGIIAISKYFGYSDIRTKIKSVLKLNHIALKSHKDSRGSRKYEFKQDYFKNIDSENKAYILGLIVSDGYIPPQKCRFTFQIKDLEILQFITKELNTDQPINNEYIFDKRTNKTYQKYTLNINSTKLVKDLYKLNIFNKKSFNAEMPNIALQYYPDFFRGLFDGDGSIAKEGLRYRYSQIATLPIMNILLNEFSNLNINKTKLIDICSNNPDKIFKIKQGSNKDLNSLFNYMYHDNNIFYLKRKYNKFNKAIQHGRN